MKIEIEVPTMRVFDAIVSGIDSGIAYWARVLDFRVEPSTAVVDSLGLGTTFVCRLLERETNEVIMLEGTWTEAVQLMAQRHPLSFATLLNGTGDSTTGDTLIQLAAFGELRYG